MVALLGGGSGRDGLTVAGVVSCCHPHIFQPADSGCRVPYRVKAASERILLLTLE